MSDLDGGGIYRQDHILGIERDVPLRQREPLAPQIEEVRAIRYTDGETYVNVNDLAKGMKKIAFNTNCTSMSVLRFINVVNQHLQGD